MFVDQITVGPVCTNCYILEDEATKQCAIIDPGAEAKAILSRAERRGAKPVMILLTHGHYDHVNGVRDILHLAGPMPVYIHRADYPHAPAGIYSPKGLGTLDAVRFYDEGDTLTLGEITIRVMATPGHTAGGVTLIAGDALFTGDTLFCGSCGRTDFETSSVPDMMASLRRLAGLEGNYRVYPGHDAFSTLEQERKDNPYLIYAQHQK